MSSETTKETMFGRTTQLAVGMLLAAGAGLFPQTQAQAQQPEAMFVHGESGGLISP
jgi:hypothetical protein